MTPEIENAIYLAVMYGFELGRQNDLSYKELQKKLNPNEIMKLAKLAEHVYQLEYVV